MGKIKQGILGGFSGKVGPVIGSSWKGKAIMRARALSVHNPNTDAQKEVRNKLTLVAKFISKVNNAVKIGFKNYAVGMTAQNAAVKLNLAEAVTGSGALLSLDWTKVKISRGELPNPKDPEAAASTGHKVTVSWTPNAGVTREALEGDHVMVVVYNATKKTALFDESAERGSSSTEEVSVEFTHSADWASDSLQVFLFTYSDNGKLTSDTIRVGEVTAQ